MSKSINNENLVCEYCGKVKKEISFVIGASNKSDWCMHEGTGKVSCPDCYEIAQKESQRIISSLKIA